MSKALEYIEKILATIKEIDEVYGSMTVELDYENRKEIDLMHIIENNNFNAAQGYKLAKMMKDSREHRRVLKNELEALLKVKLSFIDSDKSKIKLTDLKTRVRDISELHERLNREKTYRPRALHTVNLNELLE